ncbi:MAG: hypothetical protein IKU43_06530 [Clostridia bacterium]|nr:hypothetical protein [Clostridia bacterium]
MKELQQLKFEELSVKQKIGMCMCASILNNEESNEFTYDLIRNHSLGAVWINTTVKNFEECIKKIHEIADYPILIVRDSEGGSKYCYTGYHNPLAIADSEELAYLFGKAVGVTARNQGYNVICNPVVDLANGNCECGLNVRSMGPDKKKVARLAAAEVRGMHDAGVLAVAKHYPGLSQSPQADSHMAETFVPDSLEDVKDYNLYPYKYLMERDLLDGIMTGHCRFASVDNDNPASLSRKAIGLIRELGFDGFAITDALSMMGVVAKYGLNECKGLSIERGNDLALVWCDTRDAYAAMCECYDKGILTDKALDEAAARVLRCQSRIIIEPKYTTFTEEEIKESARLNTDTIYARTDEGVPVAISKEGKHFFAVLTEMDTDISDAGKVDVATFEKRWYKPAILMQKISEKFPNSTVYAIHQFPTGSENSRILSKSLDYDDVIFVTFMGCEAYIGEERFTPRILSLMRSMQVTNRISTVVHFGNPYVLEDVPHMPRILIGTTNHDNNLSAIEVLAGEREAKGTLVYDVKFR